MVKNIVFDAAGVLVEWDPVTWFSGHYGPELGPQVLAAAMGSRYWMDNVDWGFVTEDELFRHQIEAFPHLAAELAELDRIWHTILQPKTDTEDLVRRLKEVGYRVYYLSNFPERTFRWLLDHTPVFGRMDGGVVSYDVHQVKPNADIYETLLTRYGLAADETVFTDDTVINVDGAQRAGLHAWHFTGAAGFEWYLRHDLGLSF